MRTKIYIIAGLVLFAVTGIFVSDNVSAVNYVKGASINGHVGQPGHTKFKVNLHFNNSSSACNNHCDQVDSKFPCTEHGDDYTTKICSDKEWYTHSTTEWNYYEVKLKPCSGNQQNMQGTFRVKRKYTLTADAKSTIGGVDKVIKSGIDSDTVYYGKKASVTSANYNPEGYTWNKWGSQGKCASAGTARACNNIVTMKGNYTVNAWYIRNHFKGRARAFLDESASGSSLVSTGYVDTDKTEKTSIDMDNSGRKVTWDLYLKTVAGTGKTHFTGTGYSSGDWKHQSPYAPSTDGTLMRVVTNRVDPGEELCKHIKFRPYGTLGNSDTRTAEACVKGKVTNFAGRSRATDGAGQAWADISDSHKVDTDWQSSGTTKVTYYINNCDPVNGCSGSLRHMIKRSGSIGNTEYSVVRKSNYKSIDGGTVTSGTSVDFGDSNSKSISVTNFYNKLYPGQVVCETLTFKASNDTTTTVKDVKTTACLSALGDAQPGDPNPDTPEDPNSPSGDSSFLNIKVRNTSVAQWNKFQREVYAKPGSIDTTDRKGDTVEYRATYNPVLQYTYYLSPEQMRIDGGTVYDGGSMLYKLFNKYKSPGWNNDISVFSTNFTTAAYNKDFSYTNGDQQKRIEPNSHVVQAAEAGRSVNETAQTNRNNTTKTTLSQVRFTKNSDKNLANAITTQITKTAYVRVPYNFKNETEVLDDQDVFYAGEDISVKFDIDTQPIHNSVTDGTYATIVRGAKWKLEVCFNGTDCHQTAEKTGNLNGSYKLDGNKEQKDIKINVPDIPAGSDICIRSMVYPANSGDAKNWSDPEGNHQWAYSSAPKCFKVAKKPSLQVWGGNVYTGGKIITALSEKGNLAGYNAYSIQGDYNKRIFGSWSELGVVASASVTGFSSASSLGYKENVGGVVWPNYRFVGADGTTKSYLGGGNASIADKQPGGSGETNFCNRVPLTIANKPCSGNTTGSIGTSAATNKAANDKTSVLNKLMVNNEDLNSTDYAYSATDLSVGTTIVSETDGRIKVFYAANDVNINGDIIYAGSYKDLKQVPKVVIYASKDIVINCDVNRIDALLIADREVKTCNSDNIDARSNSNQLIVNGAIVANKLVANRTYGAASGANSIIPAEVINFDPTLYLWGGIKDEESSQDRKLDTSYIHELAPRQ